MENRFRLPFKIREHSDERGFSFYLDAGLKNFHIVSIKPGCIRGNHSHSYNEVAIVLGGKEAALIEIQVEGEWNSFVADQDFYPVFFPASLKHKIQNIGKREFFLVCFQY